MTEPIKKQPTKKELSNCIDFINKKLLDLPQLEIETIHHFSDGIYAREIRIPAGALLVGKQHKYEHLNIISQGDIMVMTDEGIKRVKAPATIKSSPGIRRVGHAISDTVWTTIHPNPDNIEDLNELEQIFIVNDTINLDSESEVPLCPG